MSNPEIIVSRRKWKYQLFSEKHPELYRASRTFLPRLPVILPLIFILCVTTVNFSRGDYYFVKRWYDESIFAEAISLLSNKVELMAWFDRYGALIIVAGICIIFGAILFYRIIWRGIFKDYIRFTENVETFEGRIYWREGIGFWFNLWDRLYESHLRKRAYRKYQKAVKTPRGLNEKHLSRKGYFQRWEKDRPYAPDRRPYRIYLKTRFFPPINLINPALKLKKVNLKANEKMEKRGAFEIIIHEGLYRRITGIREFETHNESYESAPIQLREALAIYGSRVKELIRDTQQLSKANVKVRLDQVRSGTFIMDEELRKMILEKRKNERGSREESPGA